MLRVAWVPLTFCVLLGEYEKVVRVFVFVVVQLAFNRLIALLTGGPIPVNAGMGLLLSCLDFFFIKMSYVFLSVCTLSKGLYPSFL